MEVSLGSPVSVSGGKVRLVPAGVPIKRGTVALARMQAALPSPLPLELTVVAGLRSACWIGTADQLAPGLGRLSHWTTARLDSRVRLTLDRHVRGYLGVANPSDFAAVLVALPTGGVLVVPVEDLDARLDRVVVP